MQACLGGTHAALKVRQQLVGLVALASQAIEFLLNVHRLGTLRRQGPVQRLLLVLQAHVYLPHLLAISRQFRLETAQGLVGGRCLRGKRGPLAIPVLRLT